MASYTYKRHAYVPPTELLVEGARRPVVIVGSGPVGLTCAIDLAMRGVPTVVLDEDDVVSIGSRAICWAKRTLEIWNRLGVGRRVVDKGVSWSVGRVLNGARELFRYDLLAEDGHAFPAFVNLQQYYVEEYLVERASEFPDLVNLRWKNEVTGLTQEDDCVRLDVSTPDGRYRIKADWVIAADGARSPTRTRMGLPFVGQRFDERFLIADVRMEADFPNERIFWFAPTFHAGQSALLHRQPDNVFRIDFQLGPDADPELEKDPERVMARVRAIVGADTPVELEWCSVYSFRCARLDRFRHGRTVFVGDSAHVVSPFGARGGNGGVQDADNLCWKLALVISGDAPPSLLDTYDEERGRGADENILQSSRTTSFMSPKTAAEHRLRDGILALADRAAFARSMLNAGRLSTPCNLSGLRLQTPDPGGAGLVGRACPDAPVLAHDGRPGWLLDHLGGPFSVLAVTGEGELPNGFAERLPAGLRLIAVASRAGDVPGATIVLHDVDGLVRERYAVADGDLLLIRPDAHVAARFPAWDADAMAVALDRAKGLGETSAWEAA